MGWTRWERLAHGKTWDYDREYTGPACYELAVHWSLPSGRDDALYVGHTQNMRQRMGAYGNHGSHLWEVIDERLDQGEVLFFRFRCFDTKEEAREEEEARRADWDYPWNIQGYLPDDE